MAEKPDTGKTVNGNQSYELDDDLGEDWESAFESEDFLFDNEEEGETNSGFQEDEVGGDLDLADLFEEESANQQTTGKKDQTVAGEDDEATVALPFAASTGLNHLTPTFKEKVRRVELTFSQLHLFQKILAVAVPFLILLTASTFLFFNKNSGPEPTSQQPVPEQTAPPSQPITEQKVESKQIAPKPPPTIRKKWPFSGFFIPARHEESSTTIFIAVDLTLITRLKQGEQLPLEKETSIRNMIYQFYTNRPVYELQRYPLARGEMIRKLTAWLKKEWPDSSIETIIFNRYQVFK